MTIDVVHHHYFHFAGMEVVTQQLDTLIKQGGIIMAKIEDVNAKIAEVKAAIAAEKAEVAAAIQALKDQIAAGGTITEAQLDAVLTGVSEIGAGVADIHT